MSKLFGTEPPKSDPQTLDRVREVAAAKIRELGDDPGKYSVQTEEDRSTIRVIFVPLERGVRGGGYEVTVDRSSLTVQSLRRYQ